MAKVVFYEKPGCGGNARQKALLVSSGHELEVRNFLAERWTAVTLKPFFGAKPVPEWFNGSAPRVKSGAVRIGDLSSDAALEMMVADPILIRRPLMQVGERQVSGFDHALVDAWIGLRSTSVPVTDACIKEHATADVAHVLRPRASHPKGP